MRSVWRSWFDRVATGKVGTALERVRAARNGRGDGQPASSGEDKADDEHAAFDDADQWVEYLLSEVHPDSTAPEATHAPIESWLEETAAFCEAEVYTMLGEGTAVDAGMAEHFRQLLAERAALAASRAAHVLLQAVQHRDKEPEVPLEL